MHGAVFFDPETNVNPIPNELDLTPEQAEGVRLYRELVQQRRREGHLRRHYAEVDRLYPGLDSETRHELADAMYRKAGSATMRAHFDRT